MWTKLEKLTFEVTRQCPNKCLHCSTNSCPTANEFLPLNVIIRIIDEALPLGLKKVVISGGEPLVYQDLPRLIEHLNANNIKPVIYTSGNNCIATDTNLMGIDILLARFSKSIDRFNLSIHSHAANIHDSFMNTAGSWQRAVDFLDRAVAVGVEVQIHCVVTRTNSDHILELAKFAHSAGCSKLRLLRLVPQGRARFHYLELVPDDLQWLTLQRQVADAKEAIESEFEIVLGAHFSKSDLSHGYECSLDSNKLTIEPDGFVSVCPALNGAKSILLAPNIHTSSLESIINGTWRKRVTDMKSGSYPNECPAQELYLKDLPGVHTVKATGML